MVIEWNRSLEELTGLNRIDTLGCPIWEIQFRLIPEALKTPEAYERLRQSICQALQTGQASSPGRRGETPLQRPDGSCRSLELTTFSIRTERGFMLSVM